MTKNRKIWTIDKNDILCDNWEYFTKNKEIAKITFNRSWNAINVQAHRLGVETIINYLTSNPAILNEARDYLDGLMLGDGYIDCINTKTGSYLQSCKYKSWLDKISKDLYKYELECKVNNGYKFYNKWSSEDGTIAYKLRTHRYVEFKVMHDRWYKCWYDIDNYNEHYWHVDKDGEYFIWKKIVPKDICLTSECVANWYLGDGSITKRTHCNTYNMSLSTDGFFREDVIFLADLLSEVLDIKCSVYKRGRIHIGIRADISVFLNYIKDYEIPCYSYKFPQEAMR